MHKLLMRNSNKGKTLIKEVSRRAKVPGQHVMHQQRLDADIQEDEGDTDFS